MLTAWANCRLTHARPFRVRLKILKAITKSGPVPFERRPRATLWRSVTIIVPVLRRTVQDI